MTDAVPESLNARFAALHAERFESWEAEKLAKNIAQRAALVAAFDPAAVVQAGDTLPPFTLADDEGRPLSLDDLVADGPAVLVFFRFAGCPACNLALPYYDRQLRPALDAAGIRLVAISPHLPEQGLGEIRRRHALGYTVASDRDNRLGRALGITFSRGEVPEGQPTPGWIGALTGTGTAEFPQPAVILIDRDRTVRFVAVSPDWLDRTEAPEILAAVAGLKVREAA
ncbi:peroxiredoxin-like family protein [Sphingomonas solaris]|uniref:thioredoxin-dependent peroxiredoxin n=1 Tax=Alterirhizorhabdus solaris TaxID=2529389 RepID=A0A558QST2_9SPHN|nr:peroxiredoxin-like family protein [Sphingomonas solaris]TVV70174.1 AhpC/TSA family protein [Sphingomonas solaris]